jgi:hypothetical protein
MVSVAFAMPEQDDAHQLAKFPASNTNQHHHICYARGIYGPSGTQCAPMLDLAIFCQRVIRDRR